MALSGGAIAGIVLFALLVICVLAYYYLKSEARRAGFRGDYGSRPNKSFRLD